MLWALALPILGLPEVSGSPVPHGVALEGVVVVRAAAGVVAFGLADGQVRWTAAAPGAPVLGGRYAELGLVVVVARVGEAPWLEAWRLADGHPVGRTEPLSLPRPGGEVLELMRDSDGLLARWRLPAVMAGPLHVPELGGWVRWAAGWVPVAEPPSPPILLGPGMEPYPLRDGHQAPWRVGKEWHQVAVAPEPRRVVLLRSDQPPVDLAPPGQSPVVVRSTAGRHVAVALEGSVWQVSEGGRAVARFEGAFEAFEVVGGVTLVATATALEGRDSAGALRYIHPLLAPGPTQKIP